MTTQDFIIALFYAVDQEMLEVPKHPDAMWFVLYRGFLATFGDISFWNI